MENSKNHDYARIEIETTYVVTGRALTSFWNVYLKASYVNNAAASEKCFVFKTETPSINRSIKSFI